MISTQLTKQDSNPEHVFTSTDGYNGPVLADITCPDGIVHVTVDPAATVARVQVRTDDPTGPAADAVTNTRIHQTAEHLTVVVPPVAPTMQQFNHGGAFIGGNSYSSITVNGITFNSVGGRGTSVVRGMTGVEVLVTLPAGSGVKSTSENGSIHVYGVLAALEAGASNGSIHAETVGRVKAEAANGSIRIGTVTEWIDADSSNGSVKVDNHVGHAARVRSGNGSVAITVGAAATGQIDARTGNGSVRLYGVRGRSDLDVKASAGNGTVQKF
ncbi:hypothetical protein QZH56_36750 [Streptomyces olivoreticuli]|uniref:hypothetical protein n=1 Tax=Streptomyces olivoreticuli TaxID=68246 RepID=UPI00265B5F91|nr:hypothetical protein [Streptomyces olivoreticuli]WKK24128.1 hypothetical protein QZH56_36750 [Streptomyces olivoreticuli]